ncbi:MmgE/PrpD family protein [Bosea sp. 117]|uniref:MmgE/PrpD family protein n=1 Tax=Bosea sp. 117 TaxID=1125973 RepID=UPI0018CC4D86|nr:MmgE/PrpD family protein [Bosea sp. 117]
MSGAAATVGTMSMMSAVSRIAAWSSGFDGGAVPPAVRAVARNCLIDTVGVALAGSTAAVAGRARQVAVATSALGACRLFGTPLKLAAPAAAAVNGTAAHALDFDDNCYAGVVHGSAVIVPAAFAVAEMADASGNALVDAVIAGSEAEYALGAAATMTLYEKGWWTTGVLGPVGAAAASARLLGLDAQATGAALGLALAGTGGAKAAFGTDAKPLLAGRAAEAGVLAALLAAQGASGPLDAAEHPRGFAALFNGGVFDVAAIAALGTGWRLLDPGIDVKRIPVCLSSHAAVDAVLDLVRAHEVPVGAIARISCDVPPVVIANLAYEKPRTRQEAQFSMNFAIAASLLKGDLGLAHLDDALVREPAVVALMARISSFTGPRWDAAARLAAPEGAHVRIELDDGRVLEGFRAFPRGAAADPLRDEEIDAKFLACAALAIRPAQADALLGRLRTIETQPSVRRMFDAPTDGTP